MKLKWHMMGLSLLLLAQLSPQLFSEEARRPTLTKVTLKVIDADTGKPIPGASAGISLLLKDRYFQGWQKGKPPESNVIVIRPLGYKELENLHGQTDKDGLISFSGKQPPITFYAQVPGQYYMTLFRSSLETGADKLLLKTIRRGECQEKIVIPVPSYGKNISFTYSNETRAFEPYNQKITIPLRRIKQFPAAAAAYKVVTEIPKLPFAFDMVLGDWLPPYGEGKVKDVIIEVDKKNKADRTWNCRLEFANKDDGAFVYDSSKYRFCRFKLPHEAPLEGYQQVMTDTIPAAGEIRQFQKPAEPGRGYVENPKYYIFRIRTRRDKGGKISDALYGYSQEFLVYRNARLFAEYCINLTNRNLECRNVDKKSLWIIRAAKGDKSLGMEVSQSNPVFPEMRKGLLVNIPFYYQEYDDLFNYFGTKKDIYDKTDTAEKLLSELFAAVNSGDLNRYKQLCLPGSRAARISSFRNMTIPEPLGHPVDASEDVLLLNALLNQNDHYWAIFRYYNFANKPCKLKCMPYVIVPMQVSNGIYYLDPDEQNHTYRQLRDRLKRRFGKDAEFKLTKPIPEVWASLLNRYAMREREQQHPRTGSKVERK